jgi:hypothetical protein
MYHKPVNIVKGEIEMRKEGLRLIASSVLAVIISGCAAKQVSLVEKSRLTVEKQGGEKVRILSTDVYQQNGQIWAYGILEQRGTGASAIKTHVDIRVLAPDGSVSYETASEDVYVPCKRIGKGVHWKRFKSQLPDKLLDGSQVTMTVHSGSCNIRM